LTTCLGEAQDFTAEFSGGAVNEFARYMARFLLSEHLSAWKLRIDRLIRHPRRQRDEVGKGQSLNAALLALEVAIKVSQIKTCFLRTISERQ
jgi:hypothetical protein